MATIISHRDEGGCPLILQRLDKEAAGDANLLILLAPGACGPASFMAVPQSIDKFMILWEKLSGIKL